MLYIYSFIQKVFRKHTKYSCCAYSLKYGVIFKAIWQTLPFCKNILFVLVGCNKDTIPTPTCSLLSFSYSSLYFNSLDAGVCIHISLCVCVCVCVFKHKHICTNV